MAPVAIVAARIDALDIAAADRALAESDVRYSAAEVDAMLAGELAPPAGTERVQSLVGR